MERVSGKEDQRYKRVWGTIKYGQMASRYGKASGIDGKKCINGQGTALIIADGKNVCR